jgi:hypothetical protein
MNKKIKIYIEILPCIHASFIHNIIKFINIPIITKKNNIFKSFITTQLIIIFFLSLSVSNINIF